MRETESMWMRKLAGLVGLFSGAMMLMAQAPAGAPRPALRRDEQSPVTVRLLLDANGKVTGCKATSPRDGSAYEKALCDHVAQSAVIIPAKTADGTPVSSYLITTIRRSAGL